MKYIFKGKSSRPLNNKLVFNYPMTSDNETAYSKDVPLNSIFGRLKKIGGNTIAFNQMLQNGNFESTTGWTASSLDGFSFSVNNNVATISYTGETSGQSQIQTTCANPIKDHKYLEMYQIKKISGTCLCGTGYGGSYSIGHATPTTDWQTIGRIITATNNTARTCYVYVTRQGTPFEVQVKNVILKDLTAEFGAGNEPTLEECEKIFVKDYYAENTGELKSAAVNNVKIVGFNQWDEEWELGDLDATNGQKTAGLGNTIRAKNYISCLPNTEYYFECPAPADFRVVCFYDNEKAFISSVTFFSNTIKTTPNNAKYMLFSLTSQYASEVYKHDVCINISNADFNGMYKPYFELNKAIPATVQALDGYGWSAGNVYNSIEWENGRAYYHKRVGKLTFVSGELDWLKWDNTNIFNATFFEFPNAKAGGKGIMSKNYIWTSQRSPETQEDKTFYFVEVEIVGEEEKYSGIEIRDDNFDNTTDFETNINGVTLYYELETEVVTDITNLFPRNFDYFYMAQSFLDGYGWEAGELSNTIEWENGKPYYHKRVGRADLGDLDWEYSVPTYSSDIPVFKSHSLAGQMVRGTLDTMPNFACEKYYTTVKSRYGGNLISARSGLKNMQITSMACLNTSYQATIYLRNESYTDATEFKKAMRGVNLYYELEEEVVIDLSGIFSITFENALDGIYLPVPNAEEYYIFPTNE